MGQKEKIGAPTAITEPKETQKPKGRQFYRVMRRIDARVERTLTNPSLTAEQMRDLFAVANLSKLALSLGNPIAIYFAKELIKLSDPLIVPEETTGE